MSKQDKDETNDNDSQRMIFDMTVPALFESIQESLHEIISSKLSTMPLFDKKEEHHTLVEDITKRYSQDMDAVELYSKRYLFGIRKKLFTTKQRLDILQDYGRRMLLDSNVVDVVDDDDVNMNAVDKDVNHVDMNAVDMNAVDNIHAVDVHDASTNLRIPESMQLPKSPQDIPTEEQIKTLDEEITSLRNKLRTVKATSILYNSQLQSIQNVREHATTVTHNITVTASTTTTTSLSSSSSKQTTNPEKVIDSVTAAMIGKEGLNDMTTKGKQLIQEMVFIQSQKEDTNETAEFSQWMKEKAKQFVDTTTTSSSSSSSTRPKKKLTLEEDFEQRKDQLQLLGNHGHAGWKHTK